MHTRNVTDELVAALADSPVVLLNGARQTGKSTLVKQLASGTHDARYVTLDDATVLAGAQADPDGFLGSLPERVIIDEVQRAPDLFRAIKAQVDRRREPGRFLLTGSADIFLLPRLSESLAGRMEILTLWPFSQGELRNKQERFIDAIWEDALPPSVNANALLTKEARYAMVLQGGYPEALQRTSEKRRRAWFTSYITTLLQRDIRDLANIANLTTMPRLLALLAARTGSTLNYAELARSSGLPQTTLKRYIALLGATFLVHTLPAWSVNINKRLVKAPKLMLSDSGLMAQLVGLSITNIATQGQWYGQALENFVVMELAKQRTWSDRQPALFHFRTQAGREVDIVLEDASGKVVGIEVKAGQVGREDFKGLRALAEAARDAFHRGIVLYQGREVVAFGNRLYAVPLEALWA